MKNAETASNLSWRFEDTGDDGIFGAVVARTAAADILEIDVLEEERSE